MLYPDGRLRKTSYPELRDFFSRDAAQAALDDFARRLALREPRL